jgi:hypothetical protein
LNLGRAFTLERAAVRHVGRCREFGGGCHLQRKRRIKLGHFCITKKIDASALKIKKLNRNPVPSNRQCRKTRAAFGGSVTGDKLDSEKWCPIRALNTSAAVM